MLEIKGPNPTEVIFDQEHYAFFNTAIRNVFGVEFAELAAEKPNDAYNMLVIVVRHTAKVALRQTIDGVGVSAEMDGSKATAGLSSHKVDMLLAATSLPQEVLVSVVQEPGAAGIPLAAFQLHSL